LTEISPLLKISTFQYKFYFGLGCLFLTNISNVGNNFDFWQKFRWLEFPLNCLTKTRILEQLSSVGKAKKSFIAIYRCWTLYPRIGQTKKKTTNLSKNWVGFPLFKPQKPRPVWMTLLRRFLEITGKRLRFVYFISWTKELHLRLDLFSSISFHS